MTIKSASELHNERPFIDLTGPDGNAYVLLAKAGTYGRELGKDCVKIREDMMSSDYEHLVEVFDREFGDYIDLYR